MNLRCAAFAESGLPSKRNPHCPRAAWNTQAKWNYKGFEGSLRTFGRLRGFLISFPASCSRVTGDVIDHLPKGLARKKIRTSVLGSVWNLDVVMPKIRDTERLLSPRSKTIIPVNGSLDDDRFPLDRGVDRSYWDSIFVIPASWLLQRSRMTQRIWGQLEQLLLQKRVNDLALPAIADAAFGYRIRRSHYLKSAEVSDQVASRDLKELVDKGLLIGQGETRGRVYVGSPLIREVYLRNYEVRTNVDPFTQGA
jgi:hypothetical protein